jgi:23S rRNA (pseudouridine1915-N3)-methyltransferase
VAACTLATPCVSAAMAAPLQIRRYTVVQEVQIKPNPKKASSVEVQKQAEGEKVLKALDSRDWVVLMDERGKNLTSEDLAQLIATAGDKGTPLAFCIGGPFGHSDEVRGRSNESVRLSNMVLNHQVRDSAVNGAC